MTAAYTPEIGESDDYRCFVLDMSFDRPMYLTGSNVHPGNSLVHHVLVYALTGAQAEQAEQLDAATEGPGYTCFGGPIPLSEEGGSEGLATRLAGLSFPNQIGSWVPGASPTQYAPGTALRIDAGSRIVMQIHYSALAGQPIADETTEFQAVLTEEAPDWLVRSRPVAQRELSIPAGDPETVASITIPYYGDEPATFIGMAGHMHLLGKSLRAEIKRADGTAQCGLDIKDWDFNWQESYNFAPEHHLSIQSGDSFRLRCQFDNSMANQPVVNGVQQDPRDVTWGDGTLDEMCLLYVRTIEPYTPPRATTSCSATCVATCQDDVACLARCEGEDIQCVGCVLGNTLECDAGRACGPSILAARECLTPCFSSAIMLGGNLGMCLEAECADAWASATACLSGVISGDSCPSVRQTCGL